MAVPSVNELNRIRADYYYELRDLAAEELEYLELGSDVAEEVLVNAEVRALGLAARVLAGEPLSVNEYWEYNNRMTFN